MRASRWRCHHCCAGVVTLIALCLCPRAGATASIAMASLPSCWRHRPCRTGVCPIATLRPIVVAELASLLVLHWRPRKRCAGVIAGVGWQHCQHRAGVFPMLSCHHRPRSSDICPIATPLVRWHCTLRCLQVHSSAATATSATLLTLSSRSLSSSPSSSLSSSSSWERSSWDPPASCCTAW